MTQSTSNTHKCLVNFGNQNANCDKWFLCETLFIAFARDTESKISVIFFAKTWTQLACLHHCYLHKCKILNKKFTVSI